MGDEPQLLRIPASFRSAEEVLAVAGKLELKNILVLSERQDGSLVFLDNGLSFAEANWLCDRLKVILLMPEAFARKSI